MTGLVDSAVAGARPTIDLHGRYTLTVPEAGELMGLGRDAAYAAAERGEIPVHKHGRRLVVPTYGLLRERLQLPDEVIARLLGLEPERTNDAPGTGAPSASIPRHTTRADGDHSDGPTSPAA